MKLARAIAYMHGERTFHRDLSPRNILLTAKGREAEVAKGLAVGADAYCRDAAVAAETAQALVLAKRAAATAS